MGKISQSKHTIQKVNLNNRLHGLEALIAHLSDWRSSNSQIFRIDGHNAIGPANPAQHIFFELEDFQESDYKGMEFQKEVNGTAWNGTYYLTASTQGKAIDHLLSEYAIGKSASQIFELTYTKGKVGIPSKRRLTFKTVEEEINKGWFCKQFVKRY